MATAAAAKTPTKPLGPASAARTPTKPLAPAAAGAAAGKTPTKTPCSARARLSHASENAHPNIPGTPPPAQPTPSKPVLRSPAAVGAKSAASEKKKPSTPAPAAPPPPTRERGRRFLVAKKGARRRRDVGSVGGGGGGEIDFDKCREAARQALRASQEEFFCKQRAEAAAAMEEQLVLQDEEEVKVPAEEDERGNALEDEREGNEAELEGSSKVRAMRTKVMAKAMSSVPDPGAGRVKHLVHAFESLLTISGATSDAEKVGEGSWALPGLQPLKDEGDGDLEPPPMSVFSSADFPNAVPNRLCSSLDGNTDRLVDVDRQME